MINKNRIIEVSPTLFLNSLPTEKHSEVRDLFSDGDVDHIILLSPKDGGKRQVIPVGRKLQCKDIADVRADSVEGMEVKAFVDARKPFPDLSKRQSPARKEAVSTQTTKLQGLSHPNSRTSNVQNSLLQKQIEQLKHKLAEEQGRVMLRDQTIKELKQHIEQSEQNSYSGETGDVNESVLVDRENSVLKTEEELINRLTYMMEKEAELEQLEEDLAHRERCLKEREGQ